MALSEIKLKDIEQECMDNCFEAVQACEWCADECLDEDMDMSRCIRLCRDVADLASDHARFMARDSNYERVIESVTCEAAGCAKCVQHKRNPARHRFGRRLLECRGYRDSTAVRAS